MLKPGDKVRALRKPDTADARRIPSDAIGTVVHAYEARVQTFVRPGTRVDVDFGRHGILSDRPATEFELIGHSVRAEGH